MVDQRRFDNQRSAHKPRQTSKKPATTDDAWVSARDAAAFLGIDIRTLYAYVSRGAVRSSPAPTGRAKQYARDDLAKLKARHDARAGHGAVAASALRWGEPVMDSAITEITQQGPAYRGYLATGLARTGVAFERVAELLWQGYLPPVDVPWTRTAPANLDRLLTVAANATSLDLMTLLTTALALGDQQRHDTRPDALVQVGRHLIPLLACACSGDRSASGFVRLLRQPSVADIVATALAAPSELRPLLEQSLVLLADHELNASSFAARIAASAEADGYAVVNAGLAVLSGTGHGAHSLRVEAMLNQIAKPSDARAAVRTMRERGIALPGFGHSLYPDGDPRGTALLGAALARAGKRPRLQVVAAVLDATQGWAMPNIDFALAALCAAYDLPPGTGVTLFAIGRTAGWIAHAMEQRTAAYLLRPRARYVGVPIRAS